ncbi:MAG TPA: hypothetical protein VHC72_21060, partial [Bryobacteraceae bacterium]|nr:hypothetical protein [Bryobacteraceae bacterium]
WMNSYFGGAVSATAGALVFGALASLRTSGKKRTPAVLCACGIILLFATRPFEALLWLGVAVVYAAWFLRQSATPRRMIWHNLAVPFCAIFLIGAGWLAYYNWRVTGNPANPPYLEYRRIYGTPQPYWWQPPVVISRFDYPELRDNYLNQVHLYQARYSPAAIFDAERERLRNFWRFFVGPFLTPAVLFLGAIFRDRRIRPWLLISAVFILDKATYHAWFPAQNGPATVLVMLVIAQCWRHLRVWQRRRFIGIAATRMVASAFVLAIALGGLGRAVEPALPRGFRHITPIWESLYPPRRLRDEVTARLESIPGKHLVFVKYASGHCFCEEWVFNSADPMSQRVVYVRPYSPESDEALIRTFKGFDPWVVEPDSHPYRLSRLTMDEVDFLSRAAVPDANDLFDSH